MNTKAVVTKVNLITKEIEGLMLADGSFAISLQQLRELAFPSTSTSNAKKHIQAICGKQFQLIRQKTELSNNPQWVITLEQLSYVLLKLVAKGHKEALILADELQQLSLHQLFCDAFNIKFEKEEREEWIKYRQQTRQQYHPYLTYWLGRDGTKHSYQYGYKVNQFKRATNLPIHNVNEYNTDELRMLSEAEIRYDLLRSLDKSHEEALIFLSK
jgi:hypothetical protein